MSSKSLAKAAREAIDRQDYGTALRLCDSGLEIEDNHYQLLVFKAVSLQNLSRIPDAIESYKLAIAVQPTLSLAWQGITTLYEREERWSAAIEGLDKLLNLTPTSEGQKIKELRRRRIECLKNCHRLEEVAKEVSKLRCDGEEESLELLDEEIALRESYENGEISKQVESRRFRLGSPPLEVLKEEVTRTVFGASNVDRLMKLRLGLEMDLRMVERYLDRMMKKIPAIADIKGKREMMNEVLEMANSIKNDSLKAVSFIREFTDWPNIFQIVVRVEDGALCSLLVVTREKWLAKDLKGTQTDLHQCLAIADRYGKDYGINFANVKKQLRRLQGLVFTADSRWTDAIPLLINDSHEEDIEVVNALIKCYEGLDNPLEAINCYQILLSHESGDTCMILANIGWQHFLLKEYETSLDYLLKAQSDDATVLYRLGRVYWEMGDANRRDKEKCLTFFLKSAKKDGQCWESFLYLGHYYEEIEGDLVKAERCYLKTLSVYGDCLDVGLCVASLWVYQASSLLDITQRKGVLQKVIRVLEPFCPDHYRNSKLWMLLGMAFSGVSKYSQSATAFQNALKGDDPDEKRCLLGVAEGYSKEGRWVAAGKVYQKLLQMDNGNVTAIYGMAMVEAALECYEESADRLLLISNGNAHVKLQRLWMLQRYSMKLIKIGAVGKAVLIIGEILQSYKDCTELLGCWSLLSRVAISLFYLKDVAGELSTIDIGKVEEELCEEYIGNEVWEGIINAIGTPSLPKILVTAVKVSCLCQINIIMSSEDEVVIAGCWTELARSLLHIPHNGALLALLRDCAEQSGDPLIKGIVWLLSDRYDLAQHYFALIPDYLMLAYLYRQLGDASLAVQALQRMSIDEVEAPEPRIFSCLLDHVKDSGSMVDTGMAAEMAEISAGAIQMLDALRMARKGSLDVKEKARIKIIAMHRLAFNPNDLLALDLVKSMDSKDYLPLATLVTSAQDHEELSLLLDQAKEVDTPTSYALRAYILHKLAKDDEIIPLLLSKVEANFYSDALWSDLHFWYGHLKSIELEKDVQDWMRLKVTVEVIWILPLSAIQMILEVYPSISDDLKRSLKDRECFHTDFTQRHLLKLL